jgi:hypothetical protein
MAPRGPRAVGFHMGPHVDARGLIASTFWARDRATRGLSWDVLATMWQSQQGLFTCTGSDRCTNVLMCCDTREDDTEVMY